MGNQFFPAKESMRSGPRLKPSPPVVCLLGRSRKIHPAVFARQNWSEGRQRMILRLRKEIPGFKLPQCLHHQLRTDRRQASIHIHRRLFLPNRAHLRKKHIARVQPFVEPHRGDAGHYLAVGYCPLDGRGAPILRQQRSMQIDIPEPRQFQHPLRDNPSIGDHKNRIRPDCLELRAKLRIVLDLLRLHRGQRQTQSRLLYRRNLYSQSTACRAIRLRHDQRDLMPRRHHRLERRHCKLRRPTKYQPHRLLPRRSTRSSLSSNARTNEVCISNNKVYAPRSGRFARSGPCGSTLPLAVLNQLLHLANHQVPLQSAQAVNKQNSVQMIDLMLKRPRQQLFAFNLEPFALHILGPHLDLCGAGNLLANLRQTQASFFFNLFSLARDDRRIDEPNLLLRILLEAHIDHRNALRDCDLGSRQPNPLRRIHALKHLFCELLQLRVEHRHGCTRLLQYRIRPLHYFMNLHDALFRVFFRHALNLFSLIFPPINKPRNQYFRICSQYPSKFRFISFSESPPNFSTTSLATVSATIASAATPAAGTTQTSLRSYAAFTGSRVAKLTLASGRLRVEIGFRYPRTTTSSPFEMPPSSPPALLCSRENFVNPSPSYPIASWTADPP